MKNQIYSREPLSFYGAIPIFSEQDEYTANYETIARDHLKAIEQNGENPFIPEALWVQSEQSTVFLIEKYAKPEDLILDVGVGLGRVLSHFPNLRKYGMDISFGYLEVARKKGIDVCFARIEDMPYREETFDIVLCMDVLEHVLDLNFCGAKILSVLKDHGTLIVRVPFREVLKPYIESDYPYQLAHLRSFDEHSLRLFFEKILDCRIVEVQQAGYVLCGDYRIRNRDLFNADEYNALMTWISKLEKISPSLYWDILRKLHLAIEFNAVIQKTAVHRTRFLPRPDGLPPRAVIPQSAALEADHAPPPVCPAMIEATQSFQSRLSDSLQKIAYLEVKLAESRMGFSLADTRDKLVSERDGLLSRIEKMTEDREKLGVELERVNGALDRISEERRLLLAERNFLSSELEQVKADRERVCHETRTSVLRLRIALAAVSLMGLLLLARFVF
jgi:SAM-dependent methyltransferase